ncbi:coatomer subunit alpha [Asimina triloba]
MADVSSVGALVPSVKAEAKSSASTAPAAVFSDDAAAETDVNSGDGAANNGGLEVLDKDFLCPICMQIIKDAFLTACGHSFCYMCIVTHLHNKNDCPCCGHYLTNHQLFPNFLLNKVNYRNWQSLFVRRCILCALDELHFDKADCLGRCPLKSPISALDPVGNAPQGRVMFSLVLLKKTSARQIAKTASPVEHFRLALQQGCEVSVKELDSLLSLLSEKKRKMEQEEAETNMQILLDFLHRLRKQKLDELNEVQTDLQYIKDDINTVERHRIELYRARERYSVKLRMLLDDPMSAKVWPPSVDKLNSTVVSSACSVQGVAYSGNFPNKKVDGKGQRQSQGQQRKEAFGGSDPPNVLTQSGAVARKRRVHVQVLKLGFIFNDLQECYLQKRRHGASHPPKEEERDVNAINKEGYHAGLEDFQSVLTTFTRYSRLRVIAELRHGDLFHSANIVSSIEFDRDDELFATAGVSRRIKVFEFASVVNDPADVHCSVVEMPTRSKLSCLSWNKYTKNHIASSDYEGIVTVWDVTTQQSVREYEEHEKRAWSVDFSRTEPSMLVSGSDDCKVGSADHHIHYYDLRNASVPVHVFSGHKKAVSYVKFLTNNELASASTDSTLRLWDVKENCPLRTFQGHTNEKNFVGLTVNSEYLACGSETNEVFVYHKAISKPAAWHRFGSSDMDETDDDAGSYFISAVCWKSDSPTMLTANSQGTIKVLVLAA